MQATHGCMRVPGALGAALVEHLGQAIGVFRKMLQRHRAVFDKGHRFAVTFHRHHDVQAGLAYFPEFTLYRRINHLDHAAGQAAIGHQFNQFFQPADLFIAIVPGKLHQQNGRRLAFDALIDDRQKSRIAARQFDHRVVDQLNRGRLQLDDVLRRFHRLVESREVADAEGLVFRQRRQLEFDTPREGQRAFGSDQQMRHVGACGQHHIEVVTADATQHFRITQLDLFSLAPRDQFDAGHQIAITLRSVQQLQILGQGAEAVRTAIGQPGIDAQHVVHHIAVLN